MEGLAGSAGAFNIIQMATAGCEAARTESHPPQQTHLSETECWFEHEGAHKKKNMKLKQALCDTLAKPQEESI